MLQKNDIVTLTTESITSEGSGIGRVDGIAVFVPMTAPMDVLRVRIVKVQKSYCYGVVDEIITPSPHRIAVDCDSFARCGGCALRHLDYSCELAQKRQWVADAVSRLGGLGTPVGDIVPSPMVDCYRNKAQYPLGRDADGKVFCGFYAQRSHNIVPATDCKLQPARFGQVCRAVCGYLDDEQVSLYDEVTGKGLVRHLYIRHAEATDKLMVCLVINGNAIPQPQRLIDRLTGIPVDIDSIYLNHNTHNTNVILGDRSTLLHGNAVITDALCGVEVDISPLSFYQVNRGGAERLYTEAARMAELADGQLLLDLYCGAGTIGLSMVRSKPNTTLIGVEVIGAAVANATANAKRAGIVNARFIEGDAGVAATKLASEGLHPDVVVVDPPRKGCDESTLAAIVTMSPTRVVMVSCNPSTMARDTRWLCDHGYHAVEVTPVDMFPRTAHVETCVLLSHKNS